MLPAGLEQIDVSASLRVSRSVDSNIFAHEFDNIVKLHDFDSYTHCFDNIVMLQMPRITDDVNYSLVPDFWQYGGLALSTLFNLVQIPYAV